MVDAGLTRVLLGIQKLLELAAVAVHVGQIQGAEVLVERSVPEFVVDVEEKGVLDVLRGLRVCHPVKFVYTGSGLCCSGFTYSV